MQEQKVRTVTLAVPNLKEEDETTNRSRSQSLGRGSDKTLSQASIRKRTRMSRSKKSDDIDHDSDCEFCGDQKRPCKMSIKALRKELIEYLDKLFETRQRNFIKFIENDLSIEEQVDPRN